jgi:hypothetical protein
MTAHFRVIAAASLHESLTATQPGPLFVIKGLAGIRWRLGNGSRVPVDLLLDVSQSFIKLSATPSKGGMRKIVHSDVRACGNLLLAIPATTIIQIPAVLTDLSRKQWMASDIIGTCVLIPLFLMGSFAPMAWIRLGEQQR